MTDQQASTRILGSLAKTSDGKGVIRIEDRFDTNINDLWLALTDPRRLAHWYGEIEGDLHAGGEYHARLYASGWEGTSRIEVCEPPNRFKVVGQDPDEPEPTSTEVTLSAVGNQTLMVVEHVGIALNMLPAYGAGLQVHVEDLERYLKGLERNADSRWDELSPHWDDIARGLEGMNG